jgi:dienelactone hydrolase
MHLYGGAVHSFTSPGADGSNPAIRYDRRADLLSWQAMVELFNEVF